MLNHFYDAENVEVGPSPYSISDTLERMRNLLTSFKQAPWTLQRLCELLLEPSKQYSKLPKVSCLQCVLNRYESSCVAPSNAEYTILLP